MEPMLEMMIKEMKQDIREIKGDVNKLVAKDNKVIGGAIVISFIITILFQTASLFFKH